MDELLIGSTFPVVVSNVTFTTRELCASLTGVAEHGRSQELRVYPSPVSAGTAISMDLSEVKDVTRVECIASDGRLLRTEFPAAGAQQLTLDTKGLPPGIHLIRTVDRDGRSGRTARFVVE